MSMKKLLSALIIVAALCYATLATANPTQTGPTGLLNVPTADTLDSGNICIGLWGDISKSNDRHALIMPATITLGIGSFWEIYGTYPNLLFNNQEEASGRGTADLGTKLRVIGERNSHFKMAGDIFAKRRISNNPDRDGVTDIGGRLIASFRTSRFGVHAYGGYLSPGNLPGVPSDDQILFGGGVEVSPTPRTKLTAEFFGSHSTDFTNGVLHPLEGALGFQFYISPHLTFNVSGGAGFNPVSPDWRTVVGFTTCQGVGTYIKPIPQVVEDVETPVEKVVKPLKIQPITPLVQSPTAVAPVSKLEVPVQPAHEEIVIMPYGQVTVPQQPVRTQVVLPVLTQNVPKPPVKEEVRVAQKGEVVVTKPAKGESPLYAVAAKGDNVEITSNATPKLPETMTVYRKFRFPDEMFEFGQMDLSQDVKNSLSEVAEQIRADKKLAYIRIDGHTDSIGSDRYNIDLSLKRAIAVASYLITHEGIDPKMIFVKGMGRSKMIADNTTTEGRRINRRFEILFLVPKGKP